MMFPVQGGEFNRVNKKIQKHLVNPSISTERICIKSCGNGKQSLTVLSKNTIKTFSKHVSLAENEDLINNTEPPFLSYNVAVKIIELGENFIKPDHGTAQYEDLSNSIITNFKPIFKKLPGYRNAVIEDIKG